MARVTIEDCRKYIPNRFELVILAAQRAKDLSLGMPPLIHKTKDKDAVLALREIAAGAIDCDKLRALVISKYVDPMKKTLRSINQSIELENIFKDLAESAIHDQQIIDEEGYEHDDSNAPSEEFRSMIGETEGGDEHDDELEEQNSKPSKVEQFDLDVTFDDADIED